MIDNLESSARIKPNSKDVANFNHCERTFMNVLMTTNQPMTMSTREIAELLEKQHSNIKISAERLSDKGVIGTLAPQEFYHNGNTYTEYLLTKRDSLVLVAQNCPEFTAKVVDRWQELEGRAAKPMSQIELIIASAQALADVERRTTQIEQQQQKVNQNILQQGDKLHKVATKVAQVAEANLLVCCPSAAENITSIRYRMNDEYGLSSAVVDAVMRQSPYAPKPMGMVRNKNDNANGSSYAVYWKKDVTAVFNRFVNECEAVSFTMYKHPFVDQKFKLKK